MGPSRRIAINALATFSRSIISAGLAFLSSRWVLSTLGHSDYGLYSLTGSVIVLIAVLNTVMSNSTARNFAYAIGKEDSEGINRWFNAAVGLHFLLACALTIIGAAAGEITIKHLLVIPPERLAASIFVFRISLVSAFAGMVSVPFVAMFTARQRIFEIAIWGLFQSLLAFSLAWILRHLPGDKLAVFAFGMCTIICLTQLVLTMRAMLIFPECRVAPRRLLDKKRTREIASFATWNLIGTVGSLGRDHGSAPLLNSFFGAKANAAYGIALQVSSQANLLSAAMLNAFAPEITATEGRGERECMLLMSMRASKFGTLLVLPITIPLLIEAPYLLDLWLGSPPANASTFCRFILLKFLVERLTAGYALAISAHGRIVAYQATVGGSLLLTTPLSWILLSKGLPATSIGVAFLVTIVMAGIGRIYWGHKLLKIKPFQWAISVLVPSVCVISLSSIGAFAPIWFFAPSFGRLALSITLSTSMFLVSAWVIALSRKERGMIMTRIFVPITQHIRSGSSRGSTPRADSSS